MKYANYQIEDFLMDDVFVEWVKYPTPETNAFWQNFVRDFPEQASVVSQARTFLTSLQFDELDVPHSVVNAEWGRFRETMVKAEDTYIIPVIPLYTRRLWWAAAATVAGLLLGFILWPNRVPSDIIYRTAFGQIKQVVLPDGSQLTLNANTEIRIPGNWDERNTRDVWLKGEGFFHVVKRPHLPQTRFLVHTDGAMVEVLGTAFNVRSRRGESDVLLQSGSVRLRLAGADTVRTLLMRPGDGVRFQAATGILKHWTAPTDGMGSWTKGVLRLDNITLRELGQIIEDTYGRPVIIRSPVLAKRVLSGSLPTQNEQALLEGISITLNVPVHQQPDRIEFGD